MSSILCKVGSVGVKVVLGGTLSLMVPQSCMGVFMYKFPLISRCWRFLIEGITVMCSKNVVTVSNGAWQFILI